MHFSYGLQFHMLHTSVRPSYVAVKVPEAVVAGGVLVPKLLAPAALLR
jgi:hypothetical protein